MMTLEEAIAYGKRTGVKYYVKNQHGCIVGGSKTLEGAERIKADQEAEAADNPWEPGGTFTIELV